MATSPCLTRHCCDCVHRYEKTLYPHIIEREPVFASLKCGHRSWNTWSSQTGVTSCPPMSSCALDSIACLPSGFVLESQAYLRACASIWSLVFCICLSSGEKMETASFGTVKNQVLILPFSMCPPIFRVYSFRLLSFLSLIPLLCKWLLPITNLFIKSPQSL